MSRRDLAPRTPDDELLVPCCYGSAANGPGACTCWREVYDQPQQPVQRVARFEVRPDRCDDCASRFGSPERSEVDGREGQWEEVLANARAGRTPFYCHRAADGTPMRRIVAERHPDGREVAVEGGDDYDPPESSFRGCRVPHLADGRPAPICAGWARIARAHGHDWFDRDDPPKGWRR